MSLVLAIALLLGFDSFSKIEIASVLGNTSVSRIVSRLIFALEFWVTSLSLIINSDDSHSTVFVSNFAINSFFSLLRFFFIFLLFALNSLMYGSS